MSHAALTSLPDPRPSAAREPSWRAALELLWHRREVEVFGTLVRVCIPVIGAAPDSGLARRLTEALSTLWAGHALSPDAEVHAVVAEFHDGPAGRELVLLISIDHSPRDHSIVGSRMVRDVRQALRLVRRPEDDVAARAA